MHPLAFRLAAMDFEDFTSPLRNRNGSARDFFLILGAVGAVTVVLLLWAAFLRKRRRHRSHHHHHQPHDNVRASSPDAAQSGSFSGKKRRRRRREHRPRNPTLAETGGLPPAHPDKSIEP